MPISAYYTRKSTPKSRHRYLSYNTNLPSKGQFSDVGTGLAPVRLGRADDGHGTDLHPHSDRGEPCPYGIPLLNASWYNVPQESYG